MGLSALVDKEIKMNRKPSLKVIDIEDIAENPLNKFSQEGIEELAENIRMYGLMKPLEVFYDVENDFYLLTGGHRRLKALKKLCQRGQIDSEVPCLVYNSPNSSSLVEEKMRIIISNAQREMTEKDKIKITEELLNILEEDPAIKSKNVTTREWIAPFLGCSPRTVQKYINLAKGCENKKKPLHEDNSFQLKSLQTSISKIYQCRVKVTNSSIQFKCSDVKELNDLLEKLGIQSKLDDVTV